MHSFHPPAKVDVRDLLDQASALAANTRAPVVTRDGWQFEVNPETYEQLVKAGEGWGLSANWGRWRIFGIELVSSGTIPEGELHLVFRVAKTFRTEL